MERTGNPAPSSLCPFLGLFLENKFQNNFGKNKRALRPNSGCSESRLGPEYRMLKK